MIEIDKMDAADVDAWKRHPAGQWLMQQLSIRREEARRAAEGASSDNNEGTLRFHAARARAMAEIAGLIERAKGQE